MISPTELHAAVQKAQPIFEKIQRFYQKLPSTACNCEKPGTCGAFLPEMTLMEAMQWFQVMHQTPETERVNLLRKFVEFYLTNPIRHMGCPFLSKGHCGIYEFRTFACRAYGLWSDKMGQARTQESRDGKQILLEMWQRYGIDMKPDKIVAEMDYCDQVTCQSGADITDDQLMVILEEIYLLDQALAELQTKFENQYYSDFSFLMASLALGTKKAVLGKFAVIKQLCQEGTDSRLSNLLAQIKLDRIFPAD